MRFSRNTQYAFRSILDLLVDSFSNFLTNFCFVVARQISSLKNMVLFSRCKVENLELFLQNLRQYLHPAIRYTQFRTLSSFYRQQTQIGANKKFFDRHSHIECFLCGRRSFRTHCRVFFGAQMQCSTVQNWLTHSDICNWVTSIANRDTTKKLFRFYG